MSRSQLIMSFRKTNEYLPCVVPFDRFSEIPHVVLMLMSALPSCILPAGLSTVGRTLLNHILHVRRYQLQIADSLNIFKRYFSWSCVSFFSWLRLSHRRQYFGTYYISIMQYLVFFWFSLVIYKSQWLTYHFHYFDISIWC